MTLPPLRSAVPAVRAALLWTALPSAAVVLAGVGIALAADVPPGEILREASVVAQRSPHIGALASFAVGLWTAAAAVALVGAWLPGRDPRLGRYLLGLGGVLLVLMLDDLYLLHDDVLPRIGVPQELVVVLEGLALVAVLVVHRDTLLPRPDVGVLALALIALGLSVFVDVVAELLPEGAQGVRLLVEDGAKTVGAAVLLHYVVLLVRDAVRPAATP